MPGQDNRDLRSFHNALAERVRSMHGSRCPCCAKPMVRPRRVNAANQKRRDRITVAHDRPVGFGGDVRVWVYACNGCNGDQKNRSFRAWAAMLSIAGDTRAAAVAALADIIEDFIGSNQHARANPVADTEHV